MNLKTLDILQLVATDTGLKYYLAAIEPRSVLDLRGWFRITDAGLMHLTGLTNLQDLTLSSTKITDAGLVHLKGLTKLETLNLNFCRQITDAGLVHIKGMTKLETLNLMQTQVTDAGVAELQQALPNCKIRN